MTNKWYDNCIFLFIIHILAAINSHWLFTKKFLYMIVKYFPRVTIHMKNIIQFRNFSMKCKSVVASNKCSIERTFNYATFPKPRANCMKIKDSLGVSWLHMCICN